MNEADSHNSHSMGHEPLGVSIGGIWRAVAGLSALVVASLVAMAGLLNVFEANDPQVPGDEAAAIQVPMPPTVPQLDPGQPVELRELRQRESQFLSQYQWINELEGVARIPIDRAIEIVASQGLPNYKPGTNSAARASQNESGDAAAPSTSKSP